jgi:hypothetical protein
MTRRQTFDRYRAKYYMQPTDQTMDEICTLPSGFQLQKHQAFLEQWVTENEWQSLLLYHEIGSGKTCTSITIAEAVLERHRGMNVKVILPAELRTNFVTELLGPCTGGKYDDEGSSPYDIMSINKFVNRTKRRRHDLEAFFGEFTQNTVFILDEIQTMVSPGLKDKQMEDILESGVMERSSTKNVHAAMVRALTFFAHPSAKFVFLTATPLFDSIAELVQLAFLMNDRKGRRVEERFRGKDHLRISDFVPLFRGKVSYFPKLSPRAYPSILRLIVNVPCTVEIAENLDNIEIEKKTNEDKEFEEMFMAKQRQGALYYDIDFDNGMESEEEVDENGEAVVDATTGLTKKRFVKQPPFKGPTTDDYLHDHAPKIFACLQKLMDPDMVGKHCVYCSFVTHGLNILIAALEARGWSNVTERAVPGSANYRRFVVWKGGMDDDAVKIPVMRRLNDIANVDGRDVRLVLGSPAIKAGISFKHMQHMHVLDSTWNISSVRQIEGRVNRYCSHVAITPAMERDLGLKRRVIIHTYFLRREDKPTIDDMILSIVRRKQDLTKKGEDMLQNVAIDHWLFQELRGPAHPEDRRDRGGPQSPVHFEDDSISGQSSKNVCGKNGYQIDEQVVLDTNGDFDEDKDGNVITKKGNDKCLPGHHKFFVRKGVNVLTGFPTIATCCNPDEEYAQRKIGDFYYAMDQAASVRQRQRTRRVNKRHRLGTGSDSEDVPIVKERVRKFPTKKKREKRASLDSDTMGKGVRLSDTKKTNKPPIHVRVHRLYGSRVNQLTNAQIEAVNKFPTREEANRYLGQASSSSAVLEHERLAQLARTTIDLLEKPV